jgi:hypothetical protein
MCDLVFSSRPNLVALLIHYMVFPYNTATRQLIKRGECAPRSQKCTEPLPLLTLVSDELVSLLEHTVQK